MSFVVQVRQRAKGNVSSAMVLWSLAMAVDLTAWEVSRSVQARSVLWGVILTVIFGGYLGWRRRGAAVFVAPLVSWSVAWLPVWIAAMVRHGVFRGLFVGLILVTVGWIVIGTLELVCLGVGALVVRSMRRGRGASDDGVVIFGPDVKH